LRDDIAILKKYLKSRGVPADAAAELDRLCKVSEEKWSDAIKSISNLLENE
jgi:hypothetical protein